jgi:hypothetical protein
MTSSTTKILLPFFARIKIFKIQCQMAQTGSTKSVVNVIDSLEMTIARPCHQLTYGNLIDTKKISH